MSNLVQQRIAKMLSENPVVLFMKGTPDQPRCGFSARAVDVLNAVAPGFEGVDVLSDEEIRAGIKAYGNWPTIPQLYVNGELVGGCDIIMQLHNSGELHQLLGVAQPARPEPRIDISAAAAQAIRAGMSDEPGLALHLRIDNKWQAHFQLANSEGHEVKASNQGIEVLMDLATAQRADGLKIDWVETLQGAGLRIQIPGAPAAVKAMSVRELALAMQTDQAPIIIDVRPEHDRLRVPFPARHRVLDQANVASLESLDKNQPVAFLCHFGNSSRQAADHFRSLGFAQVYNIEGGIDAYARDVDSNVQRY
jgi:monothiol glutaredoxin